MGQSLLTKKHWGKRTALTAKAVPSIYEQVTDGHALGGATHFWINPLMLSRYFTKWLPYAEGVWEVAPKFFENSVHNHWGWGNPTFAQNSVSQSHSLPQGGGFKVFDPRGGEISLREYLKKRLFRNDVRYVGLVPERLFVTTDGTLVRRKRV